MKRIAIVSQSLAGGGQERVTVNIANYLAQNTNNQTVLLTAKKEDAEYKLEENIPRKTILTLNLIKDVKAIRGYLTKHKVDVAISLGLYTNFLLCLCNIGLKTKIIISERNDPAHDNISKKSKLLKKLTYWNADKYVFQTENARSFYSKKIQSKGVIIPNPIKEDLPYKSNVNNHEIVAVGRLMPQKNYPVLIKAFSMVYQKHPDYVLRIFGTGAMRKQLEQMIVKMKLDSAVILEGFCSDVHEKIKDSQIFVMSSDFEGMPNALMEAMAMGFPVVSTDCPCGGPAAIIRNGENGILVDVNNHNGLASAICTLIEDTEYRQNLASHAKSITNEYSISLIMKKWITLIG